jgi:5'-nucleotidase
MSQVQSDNNIPPFILTNDDGYQAPGMAALKDSVSHLPAQFLVVAPAEAVSGCGHTVTTHSKIVSKAEDQRGWSVAGTPADCSRLAIHQYATTSQWILSGINAGGNLGVDIFHSGTVAAVREAVFHGRKGIAISHYIAKNHAIDWNQAALWTTSILKILLERDLPENAFWNVNLPCLPQGSPMPELVDCPWDRSPLPLDYLYDANSAAYNGVYHNRPRVKGADVDVCFGGRIAISLVHI